MLVKTAVVFLPILHGWVPEPLPTFGHFVRSYQPWPPPDQTHPTSVGKIHTALGMDKYLFNSSPSEYNHLEQLVPGQALRT